MSSRSYFLVSFLFFVVLSGSALHAAEILWDGEAGDYMYCTPNNWDGNAVPEVNVLAWEAGEIEWGDLNDALIDDVNLTSPVIIDDTCNPPACAKLVVGGDSNVPGTGLEINGGFITLFELVIGYRETGVGKVVMNDGVFNMMDYSYLGVGDGGDGTLIMNGGEINCHLSDTGAGEWIDWAGGVMVPKSEKNSPLKKAKGHLQLNGGIIRCIWFQIKEGGTVDVNGGTLAVTMPDHYWGDQREVIAEYISDGRLYAYGGDPRAEVIGVDDEETGYYVISGFQYSLGQAYNPSPGHCSRWVSPDVTKLSWSPGDYADSHNLYFGTDEAAVESATTPTAELDVNSFDIPVKLLLEKTYYWRVDEVNDSDESIVKGLTWNFRVRRYIDVDDFDTYADDDEMRGVWCDWYCLDNEDSGAVVYVTTDDPNFTYGDGNSMEFTYDNDSSEGSDAYAEIADLGIGSNWMIDGAKALHLVFRGVAENPVTPGDIMYVAIEDADGDTGMVAYHDINDLQIESWHEWHIDFEDLMSSNVELDLTDVSQIYLGISGSGRGYVYFDNIRLYPARCRSELTRIHGDFDGDCTIDGYDMEIMAQAWLMSDSEVEADPSGDPPWVWYKFDEGTGTIAYNSGDGGSGLNGTFKNPSDPLWVSPGAPAIGSGDPNWALDFDGLSDNVKIPALNLDSNTVTISAWIKGEDSQISWAGIVFSRDANSCAGLSVGEEQTLAYHWNDDNWDWDSGLVVPDNEWVFAAVVVEPTQAMMYMSDGTTFSFATNIVNHDIEEFDGLTYVGWDYEQGSANRFFNGLIDDVRIYTRALELSEVMGLSGLTGMQYLPLETVSNIVIKDPPGGPYNEENRDVVNLRDYAAMADSWLTEILWP